LNKVSFMHENQLYSERLMIGKWPILHNIYVSKSAWPIILQTAVSHQFLFLDMKIGRGSLNSHGQFFSDGHRRFLGVRNW